VYKTKQKFKGGATRIIFMRMQITKKNSLVGS